MDRYKETDRHSRNRENKQYRHIQTMIDVREGGHKVRNREKLYMNRLVGWVQRK